MRKYILGLLYIICGVITFGALNAHQQYKCHHTWTNVCDQHLVNEDRALAFFFAVVPPFWVTTLLITGFYQDGISFTAYPYIKS